MICVMAILPRSSKRCIGTSVPRSRGLMKASVTFLVLLLTCLPAFAQGRGQRGAPQPAKAIAPVDFIGYWVSVVDEDWRFRMTTPRKGDYESLPLNAEGRRVADTWDLTKDNQ